MPCVYTYSIPKGMGTNVKYYISVNILGGDGDYKPVTVIADSGNDITLLTQSTANQLGLHPSIGTLLEVSGIQEDMVSRFKKINTYIQIGNFAPVIAEIGFALDNNSLQENLLGNKDILSSGKFKFTFSSDKLTITSNDGNCSHFHNDNSVSDVSFI